jgi:hypothetical protein
MAADAGAERIDRRPAIRDEADIGRRSADIGDDGVRQSGQEGRAHGARGRAGQDRLDRPVARRGRGHQGAVAAYHHQRRADARRGEPFGAAIDQVAHDRHQPRIEQRRQRATRSVQRRGQVVACRDRPTAARGHDLHRRALMGRVADREHGRDRVGVDLRRGPVDKRLERRHVERGTRIAMRVVPTVDERDRIGAERAAKSRALQLGPLEADQDQTRHTALPLDDRVGRERGRQADKTDLRRRAARAVQDLRQGRTDPLREVVARRRRLGRGAHRAGRVEQHGIGEGAAGIYAEREHQARHSGPAGRATQAATHIPIVSARAVRFSSARSVRYRNRSNGRSSPSAWYRNQAPGARSPWRASPRPRPRRAGQEGGHGHKVGSGVPRPQWFPIR